MPLGEFRKGAGRTYPANQEAGYPSSENDGPRLSISEPSLEGLRTQELEVIVIVILVVGLVGVGLAIWNRNGKGNRNSNSLQPEDFPVHKLPNSAESFVISQSGRDAHSVSQTQG